MDMTSIPMVSGLQALQQVLRATTAAKEPAVKRVNPKASRMVSFEWLDGRKARVDLADIKLLPRKSYKPIQRSPLACNGDEISLPVGDVSPTTGTPSLLTSLGIQDVSPVGTMPFTNVTNFNIPSSGFLWEEGERRHARSHAKKPLGPRSQSPLSPTAKPVPSPAVDPLVSLAFTPAHISFLLAQLPSRVRSRATGAAKDDLRTRLAKTLYHRRLAAEKADLLIFAEHMAEKMRFFESLAIKFNHPIPDEYAAYMRKADALIAKFQAQSHAPVVKQKQEEEEEDLTSDWSDNIAAWAMYHSGAGAFLETQRKWAQAKLGRNIPSGKEYEPSVHPYRRPAHERTWSERWCDIMDLVTGEKSARF
ncbi:hypothetical protein EXIGLDRAFT_703211 [Exidia glandulosa HHB12029]|uniref:Uncharacterized protein n=1 Tax=Exidia glandulosa HHB12029 TaxID=1314781 RepID=A0A165L9I1_EXIGL|nr:hypothetical protein EXIGLDRAFT_703211 [Exidia glandulosa HHB12029]